MRIVLGVGGGIAAYKVAALLRTLTESGHDVHVVPTPAALNFVGTATWEALSGNYVASQVWDNVAEVPHVNLGKNADLVIVAPATADLLSRAAAGSAQDLLTNVLLTATCPVLYVPAMHTEMWLHPATQANVATLQSRGAHVMQPASGRLTGADSGPGRLPEPEEIAATALALCRAQDLEGVNIVITAGGTREYLDPVRFLGNRSTGMQGVALAKSAVARGATVTLIAANLAVATPPGVEVVAVDTGDQMDRALKEYAPAASVIVMAAAVADYAPEHTLPTKMKKGDGANLTLTLKQTPDLLAGLAARRLPGQVLVGFAAETDDILANAAAKMQRKGCDVLVVNDVSGDLAFGSATNEVIIVTTRGQHHVPRASKDEISHSIWDVVVPLTSASRSTA